MSVFSSPWPDQNSKTLSKIKFTVPLYDLFTWLCIRDTFLGLNERKQDITAALALARDCKHPDAVWLLSVCQGVSTTEQARKVFLLDQNHALSLCFAWILGGEKLEDLTSIRRATEMGNSFSCATLSRRILGENQKEAFRLAQLAAAQHERDGFRWVGFCFVFGVGCEKNLSTALENYLLAAELGNVEAAESYGSYMHESDPFRWIWLGRAASRRWPVSFLASFASQVERFVSGSGNSCIVFLIGRALRGNIDVEQLKLFGSFYNYFSLIGPANRAVLFYEQQIIAARRAVDTWTIIAKRFKLIKDLRVLIGKLIWEARFDANYKI